MRVYYLLILIVLISCQPQSSINFSGDLEVGAEQTGSLEQKETKSYSH